MKLSGLDYPNNVAYPYMLMAASQSLTAVPPGQDYGSLEANRTSLPEDCKSDHRGSVAPNVAYFHREPRTYMSYAVLVTIFCCFPLGVPAIMYAKKAKSLSRTGQLQDARRAALKSRQMIQMSVAIGLVLWFVVFLAVIIFFHPFPST